MRTKLKTVILDDDLSAHQLLKGFCQYSESVEITQCFSDPRQFLEKLPSLDFDLCLLETMVKDMDGIAITQMLHGKPFIFITGKENKLKEATDMGPVDIVFKPYKKDRLHHALDKAKKIYHNQIKDALFNVAEGKKKLKVHIPDILFATTDEIDARNKVVILKGGASYTIMDCSHEKLLSIGTHLVQVNRNDIVSLYAIKNVHHDTVTLNEPIDNGKEKEVTLSRAFKKELQRRIHFA